MIDPDRHFPSKFIDDIREAAEDNYFQPILQDALDHVGTIHDVCDVGCGNGVFSIFVKKEAQCRLVGIDGSDYALKKAGALGFDELHLIEDLSSSRLPFKDGSFDLVLNKDVLEHLLHPEHLVGEIARILREGGYALIHVPNHFTLSGRFRFLFDNDIDTYGYFPGAKRWGFPHIRFFTYQSFVELLSLQGLQVVWNLSHHFPAIPYGRYLIPFSGLRRKLVDRYPSQFAEGFTLLARKA